MKNELTLVFAAVTLALITLITLMWSLLSPVEFIYIEGHKYEKRGIVQKHLKCCEHKYHKED